MFFFSSDLQVSMILELAFNMPLMLIIGCFQHINWMYGFIYTPDYCLKYYDTLQFSCFSWCHH